MKTTFLVIAFLSILFMVGCDYQPVEPEVVTPVALDKTSQNLPSPPFRHMQDFYNIPIEFTVDSTDILVEIQNRHLFQISSHYFITLTYQYGGSVMVYFVKPTTMNFIVPYYGTEDLVDVKLMAIFTR